MAETRRALMRGVLEQPTAADDALTFTASSTSLNRYGFRLRNAGWRLANYEQNPVVLWHHLDFLPPIGRSRTFRRDSQLISNITFDRSDPFAAQVEQKYRGGYLNAVSVGFDFVDKAGVPIRNWWSLSPEQIEKEAFYDLAEVSAVPVPADPAAVRQHHAALSAAGLELLDLAGEVDWQRQGGGLLAPPQAPVLPGNSLMEQRLAQLEAGFAQLRAQMIAIGPHSTAVEDSSWDGPAAVSAMPTEAAVLRYCHAWTDAEGDADAKASYKFPHHRTQGGPANLGGCRNGLARLEGADVPESDQAGVRQHLERHLEAQSAQSEDAWAPDAVQGFLAAIRL